jgi:recombination protein RecA
VKAGIVEKSGSWYSFDSERIGQGRENAKAYLKEHPELAERIALAIRQNAGLISQQAEAAVDDGGEDEAPSGTPGFADGDGVVAPLSERAASKRGRRGL